ncbi:hypothetical protein Pelo_7387 [Pelomyxa schiedti]|nr:hypothetical protein Pelo_7387 [Pelomyxa schiedti]
MVGCGAGGGGGRREEEEAPEPLVLPATALAAVECESLATHKLTEEDDITNQKKQQVVDDTSKAYTSLKELEKSIQDEDTITHTANKKYSNIRQHTLGGDGDGAGGVPLMVL